MSREKLLLCTILLLGILIAGSEPAFAQPPSPVVKCGLTLPGFTDLRNSSVSTDGNRFALLFEQFRAILVQCSGSEEDAVADHAIEFKDLKMDIQFRPETPNQGTVEGDADGGSAGFWSLVYNPVASASGVVGQQLVAADLYGDLSGDLNGRGACLQEPSGRSCKMDLTMTAKLMDEQGTYLLGQVTIDFTLGWNLGTPGWTIAGNDGTVAFYPAPEPEPLTPPTALPPTEQLPPAQIGNDLSDYDTDNNCELSDPEFFTLLDAWLSSSASDSTFFAGVDAWIGGGNVCPVSASGDSIRLRTSGLGLSIEAESSLGAVAIYDLTGREVFAQSTSSKKLFWNLRDHNNQPVANGVYWVNVTHNTFDGRVMRTLKPISILR